MNNNTTPEGQLTNWLLTNYSNVDLERINIIQSSISLVATICIFVKVFDFSRFFSSVKNKRKEMKKNAEKRELERVRKLINSVKDGHDLDIDELLSDGDDEESKVDVDDRGVMKIAHKKKDKFQSQV